MLQQHRLLRGSGSGSGSGGARPSSSSSSSSPSLRAAGAVVARALPPPPRLPGRRAAIAAASLVAGLAALATPWWSPEAERAGGSGGSGDAMRHTAAAATNRGPPLTAPASAAATTAVPPTATGGGGGGGSGGGGQQPPQQQPRAVNLRDIAELDAPRLRPGVLYRCSQVYAPELLAELRIRTVVDLRGRVERARALKRAAKLQQQRHQGAAGGAGAAPSPSSPEAEAEADLFVTTLGGNGGNGGSVSGSESDGAARDTAGGGVVRRAKGHEELGAGLTDVDVPGTAAGGSSGGTQQRREPAAAAAEAVAPSAGIAITAPGGGALLRDIDVGGGGGDAATMTAVVAADTETFDLIPQRQFGEVMLRMPWRVWGAAFASLATGRDPRRPFVEAFASEQLLGFTKYYTIILEHAKRNIAAVLRVFAKPDALPALVHCAHGKDRTGVVVMLLMMLCGAPREAIAADYAASEVELRRYREALGLGARGAAIPLTDAIIASTRETMRAVMEHIDARYMGVEPYLLSCGLTRAELAAIRRNLLTAEALRADGEAAAAGAAAAGEGGGGSNGKSGGGGSV